MIHKHQMSFLAFEIIVATTKADYRNILNTKCDLDLLTADKVTKNIDPERTITSIYEPQKPQNTVNVNPFAIGFVNERYNGDPAELLVISLQLAVIAYMTSTGTTTYHSYNIGMVQKEIYKWLIQEVYTKDKEDKK